MNILQIQARLKDLSDQQLQQVMQQGGAGMAPEYLVLAELNRRAGMRQSQAASQPIDNTTVAQEVMAAPGLPQAVGNQMAQAMRPEDAQQSTARFAEGGIVGLQGGGFPPLPVPKPDYVAMTPEQAEIKKSVDDFVAQVNSQYGSDSAPSPAISDADARFAESFGITDRGDLATPMVLYDGNLGTRVGSNGRQDFEADDALFRLGYDPGRMFIADTTGPNHMGPMAYAPEGASSDSGLRAPDDSIISTPMFDYAAPAYAHEFRHRGLRDLYATYKDTPIEELASILGDTSEDPVRDAEAMKNFLYSVAGAGTYRAHIENEGFIESYDDPKTPLRYPSEVTNPALTTMGDTIDYPMVSLDHSLQQLIAKREQARNSPRQMMDALAKFTLLKRFTQRYEDTFGQPVPKALLYDFVINELGGGYAEGGIVQAFEPGGQIGMNSEYTLPRISEPSALDLESLQKYEEQYGPIPEATAPAKDSQSWADWLYNLFNPRSDAQKRRDAYVPTIEDNILFRYAEGGIVRAYDDGGLFGPGWMEKKFGKGQLTDMATGPATPIGPYLQQGVTLGLTEAEAREAYSRNIPLEGLGEYKIGFVDSPRELDAAPVVAPLPPADYNLTRGTPPTAPPTPAVVTPPTPTVAAPSVSLPAATPLQVAPAPKFDEKAYTQAVSSFGVPGGVSDLTRESRRNAMLALAKAGFALAGSKEVTAGGAIGEAAKTGIAAYEAGAKDIAAQKEARRKEGIAQARQQMLDRRAMSQEQYKRYMDTVTAQQAAAARGDTRAYRNASLELQKYGIEATMARAAMTDRAAQAREAAAVTRLELGALQDELTRLNDPITVNMLSTLPEAQRTAALADINRRKAQIQARLDAFTGVSGIAGPPTPGVIDLTK